MAENLDNSDFIINVIEPPKEPRGADVAGNIINRERGTTLVGRFGNILHLMWQQVKKLNGKRIFYEALSAYVGVVMPCAVSTAIKDPRIESSITSWCSGRHISFLYPTMSWTAAPLSSGLATIIQFYITRHVPDTHGSSTITVASVISPTSTFDRSQVPSYILGQLIGTASAVSTVALSLFLGFHQICPTECVKHVYWCALMETGLSAVQTFLRCLILRKKRLDAHRGWLTGFITFFLSISGSHVSGSSMNMPRSMFAAMYSHSYGHFYVYLICPPLGGLIGGSADYLLDYLLFGKRKDAALVGDAAAADGDGAAAAAPADRDGAAAAAPAERDGTAAAAPADRAERDETAGAAPADRDGTAGAAQADRDETAGAAPADRDETVADNVAETADGSADKEHGQIGNGASITPR